MPIIVGMLNTLSFNDTDRRPKNWRETILYQEPNGAAPLTALLALTKGSALDDPEFNYWTQQLADQRGVITGVYTDALSTAYSPDTTGAKLAADGVLYLKCSEAHAKQCKAGHLVLIRDTAHLSESLGIVARITDEPTLNGASSYLKVRLLQSDVWTTKNKAYCSGESGSPTAALIFMIVGSSYAEGTGGPRALAYEPVKCHNFTQIFKTKTSMTRTAMSTKLRTGDQKRQAQQEALKMHSIEMEKAFFWGIRKEEVDAASGTPLRHTAGIINYVDQAGSLVVPRSYFSGDLLGTGDSDGYNWLFGVDGELENLFRFGSQTRLAFCGSSVISAWNLLAANNSQVNVTGVTTSFGMKFMQIQSPFGDILLKHHPLFSYEPSTRGMAVIIDPENLEYRYLQDIVYKTDVQANDVDAQDNMYLAEAGLELRFPNTFRIWNNFM